MRPVVAATAAIAALLYGQTVDAHSPASVQAQSIVSNVQPRRDTSGNIIDAHDGNVLVLNGTYFLYAAGYGLCQEPPGLNGCAQGFNGCGFFNNHSVNLFTSADLISWTAHGNVLPEENRVDAVLFSPKAIYNRLTGLYVLWYNYFPGYSYAVATSPSPYGPFVTVANNTGASTQFGAPNNTHVGDFALLADGDRGFLLYSAHAHCQVEELTPDFTASTYQTTNLTSGVLPHGNEAPALFKRGDTFYALVSESCCYCGQGGKVHAYSAPDGIGPYTYLGEIAAGWNPYTCNATNNSSSPYSNCVATSSQQTNVFPFTDSRGNTTFVWQGDRWQSAGDRLKGHDFTYYTPLQFNNDGTIQHLNWIDNFTLNL